ncbi:MAG: hypothetical protein LPK26_10335 [Bacillaceae bacterium]|nr:hypothetical protein [Bacillaceae bacterium]
MKKGLVYSQPQQGAALILVLFAIVFLGIVGAALLNMTTYSQQSIKTNSHNQSEFYRAEGALDLMISEILAHPDGPFVYLNNISTISQKTFNIGGDVKVTIEPTKVNSNEITAVLTAFSIPEPKLKRVVHIASNQVIETKEGSFGVGNTIIYADGNIGSSDKVYVSPHQITQITPIQYDAFVNVLLKNHISKRTNGLDIKNGTTTNPILISSGSYPSIGVSTNGATAVIPKDAIVHTTMLDVGANATLVVHGILAIDGIKLSGNANILVSSGIVSKDTNIKNSNNNAIRATLRDPATNLPILDKDGKPITQPTGTPCELAFGSGICIGEATEETVVTEKGTLSIKSYETKRN